MIPRDKHNSRTRKSQIGHGKNRRLTIRPPYFQLGCRQLSSPKAHQLRTLYVEHGRQCVIVGVVSHQEILVRDKIVEDARR